MVDRLMDGKKKILVVGLGSDILRDDGIGVQLTKDLQTCYAGEGVTFKTSIVGGLELLEIIKNYYMVVFIDAIKTEAGTPGDVYSFSLKNYKETLHLSNPHDTNFKATLDFGEKIGFQIPRVIRILAIEIEECLLFSNSFSKTLATKYQDILQTSQNYIKSIIALRQNELVMN